MRTNLRGGARTRLVSRHSYFSLMLLQPQTPRYHDVATLHPVEGLVSQRSQEVTTRSVPGEHDPGRANQPKMEVAARLGPQGRKNK